MKFITLIFILTLISGCSQSLDNNAFTPKPEELLKDPAYKKKILDIDDLRTEQELEKFSDLIEQSRITREDNGTEPIVVEVERIRHKEGEVLLDENGEEFIDPLHDKVQVEEYYIVDGAIIDFDSAIERTPELNENENEEEAPEAPTEEVEEVKTEVDNDTEISETEAEAAPIPPSVKSLAPKTSLRPMARKIIKIEPLEIIEEPKKEAKIPEGIMAENTVIEESTPLVPPKKNGETIPSAEENENQVIKATLNLTQTPQPSSPISKTLVEEGQELGIFIDDNEHEEVRSQPKQEAKDLENVEEEQDEPNSSRLAVEKSLRPMKRPDNLISKLAVKESLRPKARPNRESVDSSNSNNDLEVKAVFSDELAPEPETESSNIVMQADWDERKDGQEFTKLTVNALEKYGENLLNPNLKMNSGGYSRYCKQYNTLNKKKRTQFWLMFISGLSRMESGFRTDTKFKEDFTDAHGTIYSRGLLQMSIRSVNQKAYSCNVERAQDLHKPEVNLNCAVKIMNFWVKKDMAIYGVKTTKKSKRDWQGVANYWSPIRLEKYSGSKRKKHERLGEMINQMDICR
jgi:hypothetical protein